jgi:hypothetical protein
VILFYHDSEMPRQPSKVPGLDSIPQKKRTETGLTG